MPVRGQAPRIGGKAAVLGDKPRDVLSFGLNGAILRRLTRRAAPAKEAGAALILPAALQICRTHA